MNIPSTPSDASPRAPIENPWLRAFLAEPWDETILGQIIIRRKGPGFELRHTKNSAGAATELKSVRLAEVRQLANFNSEGKFRPLKSTPDLATGWILALQNPGELEYALQTFYPNALADIQTTRHWPPPITSYRAFTHRQTGMYRITAFLNDSEVARVIENVCNTICLKYRLWPIDGPTPTTSPHNFTNLVCLEPCAILLESARKQVRAIQESDRSK
jgi:hypothetical protein